jgi:short-subunit dehydrogenase
MFGRRFHYNQKVIFITGASSGIGEGLARAFAKEGANLALVARRKDRLETLAKELDPTGQRILIHQADVTLDQEVEAAVAQTIARFGAIDMAIANAGFGVAGRVETLTLADYQRQFETNIFGVLRVIKATLPAITARRGQIVLMGSIAGFISQPFASPYCMSKFALTALSEALYHEMKGKGVAVSLIAPGFVQSEIQQIDNKGQFNPKAKRWIPDWITVPTEVAVNEMMQGLKNGRRRIIVTGHGRLLLFLERFFPMILHYLVQWGAKKRLRDASQRQNKGM